MTRRVWLAWEEQFLRQVFAEYYTEAIAAVLNMDPVKVLAKANRLGLHKKREVIAALARERTADPGHPGHNTRFRKGIVPANKGTRRPGYAPGRMAETMFKKGCKPVTWKPIGSYRFRDDGVLELKVNDDPGPSYVRWKPVHRLLWEQAHGPIPRGHAVAFKAGRKTNVLEQITLDALELIDRRELMARNTVHNYPPELKRVIHLRGALNRRINAAQKEAR